MIRLALALIAPLALLVACGEEQSAPPAADTNVMVDAEPVAAAPEPMPPFAEVEGAHPYPPIPAPIPAAFRGVWAETPALCDNLDHHSILMISGATLRFPDFIVRTDDVETLGPGEIEIKGIVEGTDQPSDHHFFIDEAGRTLTDGGGGGTVRARCTQ